ncbi:conserved hypothetical protein [Talaromyces stipitatus ATCC 10500]|uniref:SnoaL-like domain-containing protein n=1 Tax=Talaromyces stipitatus (strain ATCC 10500 / CBS 375.48 / QM 6759 / NRRL 1006) TaxID=441959 RepID=B8MLT0_TALSN|nr:uncharacterized protein TSTA_100420 [Talaromyces stipitatus ATCC 10500]EED13797.1 conserved hypothetical protein [Talaromyces stipitatus ATCC 10500]
MEMISDEYGPSCHPHQYIPTKVQIYISRLLDRLPSQEKSHKPSQCINIPAPAHVQKETIDKFLDTWGNSKAQDTINLWSDDFEQRLLPFSLQQPVRRREHAEFFYPKLVNNLANWKVGIKHIVHDADKSTAAVYATSSADTPIPEEKWTNEFSIFMTLTEDGLKVKKLEEMVDSAFYQRFFPIFQKWLIESGALQ